MCTHCLYSTSLDSSAKTTCVFSNVNAVSQYKSRVTLPYRSLAFWKQSRKPKNSPEQQEGLTLKCTTQKMHFAFTPQKFQPNVQFSASDIHSNRQLPMNWKTKCFSSLTKEGLKICMVLKSYRVRMAGLGPKNVNMWADTFLCHLQSIWKITFIHYLQWTLLNSVVLIQFPKQCL